MRQTFHPAPARTPPARIPRVRTAVVLAAVAFVAGCVGPPPPAPVPRPVAIPTQQPPAPRPNGDDWRDWPVTPGDWRYARLSGSSVARFGEGGQSRLSITCDAATRQVRLAGMPEGRVTIRTTSLTRTIATMLVPGVAPGSPPYPALTLAAQDPLLDAMAFSRGRFIVEQGGQPSLVVPAWAEIGRVIEDCRR